MTTAVVLLGLQLLCLSALTITATEDVVVEENTASVEGTPQIQDEPPDKGDKVDEGTTEPAGENTASVEGTPQIQDEPPDKGDKVDEGTTEPAGENTASVERTPTLDVPSDVGDKVAEGITEPTASPSTSTLGSTLSVLVVMTIITAIFLMIAYLCESSKDVTRRDSTAKSGSTTKTELGRESLKRVETTLVGSSSKAETDTVESSSKTETISSGENESGVLQRKKLQ